MVKKHLLRAMVGCLPIVGVAERTSSQATGRIAGWVTDSSGAIMFLSYPARAWPLRFRQFRRSRDLCGKNVISGQHRRNVPFGYLPDGNASHLFHRLSVDGGN